MKKGTKATNKNCKSDDILVKDDGETYFVWAEVGAMIPGRVVLHLISETRTLQTTADMAKESFVHVGKKYVEPDPKEPEPTEDYASVLNGWLAPDGTLYRCGYSGHGSLAYRICFHAKLRDKPAKDSKVFDNDNELALEKHGYMKLSEGFGWFGRNDKKPISQRQKSTLLLWNAAQPAIAKKSLHTSTVRDVLEEDAEGFSLL
jgi:hypothetical protein